jgi:hypothetical protein
MSKAENLLKKILDDEFLQTLAKSADLYKIGSNSVLDPQEIKIGLKVVPRAVLSLLISQLTSMELNSSKDIQLPFGKEAYIRVNKNAADDYTGSVFDNNKRVYDFMNRSIPGLGIILLSTFELYDLEELSKPQKVEEDVDHKVQKLINERMELHSLVSRVVENKIVEREAIHKLMMDKLSEALKAEAKKNEKISDVTKIAHQSSSSGEYFRGMTNGMIVADSIANEKEANFVDAPKKPLEIKASDITKKEISSKKGSPLKEFLEKKSKPKEYFVQKCESMDCRDCGKTIFGSSGFSGCICFAENQNSKLFIRKNEKGELSISFSKQWSVDNIELLLETLRRKNG